MSDPVLISIAAALAGKAGTSLYDFVKRKFTGRPGAVDVLEAAEGTGPHSAEVAALGDELARAEEEDSGFRTELRARWRDMPVEQRADSGGVTNQVSGAVRGNIVQARDIEGGISF